MSRKTDRSNFNPYYYFLGIPPREQPADFYRLLGVEQFESDLEIVGVAADRQMSHLHHAESGEHADDVARLLSEVSRARLCLLNRDKKEKYDQQLRGHLERAKNEDVQDSEATSAGHHWLDQAFMDELRAAEASAIPQAATQFERDTQSLGNNTARQRALLNEEQKQRSIRRMLAIAGCIGGGLIVLLIVIVLVVASSTDRADDSQMSDSGEDDDASVVSEVDTGSDHQANSISQTDESDTPPVVADESEDDVTQQPAKIDSLITAFGALQGADPSAQLSAIRWLRSANVEAARRKDVCPLLERCLQSNDESLVHEATECLLVWGDSSHAPLIVTALEERRVSAIDALNFFDRNPHPASSEWMATRLGPGPEGLVADSALAKLGEQAVPALLEHYSSEDPIARRQVRDLLSKLQIGERRAISMQLEKLNSQADADIESAARWFSRQTPVSEDQRQVAAALEKRLTEMTLPASKAAIADALSVWADGESAPKLLAYLETLPLGVAPPTKLVRWLADNRYAPATSFLIYLLDKYPGEELGRIAETGMLNLGKEGEPETIRRLSLVQPTTRAQLLSIRAAYQKNDNSLLLASLNAALTATITNKEIRIRELTQLKLDATSLTQEERDQFGTSFARLLADPRTLESTRIDLFEMLKRVNGKAFSKQIGSMLKQLTMQRHATQYLKSLGAEGEVILHDMLRSRDWDAVAPAANVLKDIGGKRSIKPLADLAVRAKRAKKTAQFDAAVAAIEAIKERDGKPVVVTP